MQIINVNALYVHKLYKPTKLSAVLSFSDFCYGNEDLAFSISEAIKLCVTVVAYAPESFRRYGTTWIMYYSSVIFLFCSASTCLLQQTVLFYNTPASRC